MQSPTLRHCVFVLTGFQLQCSHRHSTSDSHAHSYLSKDLWEFSLLSRYQLLNFPLWTPIPSTKRKGRDKMRNTKCKSPERGPRWVYWRNRRKSTAALTWWTKKTLYKKQARVIYISEDLTGHDKDFGHCYFHKFVIPVVNKFYINET